MTLGVQLFRYTVPGALFLFVSAVYIWIFEHVWYESSIDLINSEAILGNALAALLIVLVIGFVLYQGYHFLYGISPRSNHSRAALHEIIGDDEDLRKRLEEMFDIDFSDQLPAVWPGAGSPVLPLTNARTLREARKIEALRDEGALRAIVNAASAQTEWLKKDLDGVNDVYHALGASRMAPALSLIVVAGYMAIFENLKFVEDYGLTVYALVLCLCLGCALTIVFQQCRVSAVQTIHTRLVMGIRLWMRSGADCPLNPEAQEKPEAEQVQP